MLSRMSNRCRALKRNEERCQYKGRPELRGFCGHHTPGLEPITDKRERTWSWIHVLEAAAATAAIAELLVRFSPTIAREAARVLAIVEQAQPIGSMPPKALPPPFSDLHGRERVGAQRAVSEQTPPARERVLSEIAQLSESQLSSVRSGLERVLASVPKPGSSGFEFEDYPGDKVEWAEAFIELEESKARPQK